MNKNQRGERERTRERGGTKRERRGKRIGEYIVHTHTRTRIVISDSFRNVLRLPCDG